MGNKMEEMFREVQVRTCPCGKGSYEVVFITYMDDYANKDYRDFVRSMCDECEKNYVLDGHIWAKKELYSEVGRIRALVTERLIPVRDYILDKYKDRMLQRVENMHVSAWHRLWEVPNTTINTFRKHVKSRGARTIFNEYTCGDNVFVVYRLVDLLKLMGIEDDRVQASLPELKHLVQEEQQAYSKMTANNYTGNLIREYKE